MDSIEGNQRTLLECKTVSKNESKQFFSEKIVMSPVKRDIGHTVLRLERIAVSQLDNQRVMHEAGGDHKGIVINKEAISMFLVNAATSTHTKECRQLKFWFKNGVHENERSQRAQSFFRRLVNPSEFPKDYVGFIMKLMKLMQNKYEDIKQIEIEMKQLEELDEPPSRPTEKNSILIDITLSDSNSTCKHLAKNPLPDVLQQCVPVFSKYRKGPKVTKICELVSKLPNEVSVDENSLGAKNEISAQKVLEVIESCYPNAISLSEIALSMQASEEEVHFFLNELLSKNVIKAMDNNTFMRITQNDTEVKLVKQMPKVIRSQQPTIAIITAQYAEKLAVDAMIENKDTYVRFKTEGESNVYTLGNIGWHRVVSTKLPAVGHSRGAMIAAGNTTTRLLGSFQRVEYVFMVGVGGGVPHYTDFKKHVRLGDVVVSVPPQGAEKPYIYISFEKTKNSPDERSNNPNNEITVDSFTYRTWCPPNLELQEVAQNLWQQGLENAENRTWEKYIENGAAELSDQESDFNRPSDDSDKLYMSIGTKDVIEVGHPEAPKDEYDPRKNGLPMVHFGAVGSGRIVVKDEQLRQDIANKYGVMAFDSEFDTVAESVFGNRKERYVFIRGICDYKDGTRKKEWQPCAALNAAAFMKAMIMTLSPLDD
ncbi:uncharacterized protein B4U79_04925 [Dinothrombium tinctorium]|uniref:Winged helix-turn-helix domain-containing protein n=1 Tax=Dinothrombium tinctorium TaxID=1965070 RepID=A0A443QSZ3_9ACAR|nr:uncharacterized protein B4U79_04925 [Dinothrombium tinctorium]